MRKTLFLVLLLSLSAMTASSVEPPKVSLSATRVRTPDHVTFQGYGFTARANITSHMKRPDGVEYPTLPLLTDEHGNFTHDIDTIVLTLGVHELWVIDDTTNMASNRVAFEVISEVR